jgi:hypothetical protein
MPFTEAEKRQWHADRQAGKLGHDGYVEAASETCGHCGNPFAPGQGVSTEDFALCDVCNGD